MENLAFGLFVLFGVLSVLAFILLVIAFYVWGVGGHAQEDTTQKDIKAIKNQLAIVDKRLNKMTKKLGNRNE